MQYLESLLLQSAFWLAGEDQKPYPQRFLALHLLHEPSTRHGHGFDSQPYVRKYPPNQPEQKPSLPWNLRCQRRLPILTCIPLRAHLLPPSLDSQDDQDRKQCAPCKVLPPKQDTCSNMNWNSWHQRRL